MSDDDPFAEPDDADKTVIKPNPGGRRNLSGAAPVSTPTNAPAQPSENAPPQDMQPAQSPSSGGTASAHTGMNPINAAASTLFSLVGRIRNRAQHMDAGKLRASVVGEVREFEARALQAQINAQDIKIARYAICATLDDVVLNTPWGGQSVWAQQSMVGTFHKETVGGDRFYDLLARLEREPAKNIDLLEFLYMCLALGFEGRLRVEAGGSEKHMQIRAGLARIIRGQRGQVERDLSPHWAGVNLPHKMLSVWKPLWITSAIVAVLLTGIYMSLAFVLNQSSERVMGKLLAFETTQVAELVRRAPPPPPPPPPSVEQITIIRGFLADEIAQERVEVFQDNASITVRLSGANMFGSGSDALEASYRALAGKIADGLNEVSGQIIIVGHSDNIPIKSSRFPSNMHLSLARAESVMRSLAGRMQDPFRMRAEGRADAQPIASNDTREGRAKNRRIEILLMREDAS